MKTRSIEKTVVLSTTAQQLVNNNPDRLEIIFTNLSAISTVVDIVESLTATLGILLSEGGGLVAPNVIEDGDLPTRKWFGIAASGTPSIRVIEIVKDEPVVKA